MGSLSTSEQAKLAYFHALGKVMTEGSQEVFESKYKSSHNVRLNEIWSDDIAFAVDYTSAEAEALINSAVTFHSGVTLTVIPGSNGQAYSFLSGTTFVRPWIAPVDVPNLTTNNPSNGYQVRLYKGDGTPIGITTGAWAVDYYAGIIHFALSKTPTDLSWGAIKASFFQYTGKLGLSGGTAGAFTTAEFNSGTSELIFNSGLTSELSVDLSPLNTSLSTTLSTEISDRISGETSLTTTILSVSEQAKLAYFHALGKVMIASNQIVESKYKSSHNVKLSEIWYSDITSAITYLDAVNEASINTAVTIHSGVTLSEVPDSSGQSYYYLSGSTFTRPWIAPVDVPTSLNEPSIGYQVQLFNSGGTEILSSVYSVEYYAGIIHFTSGNTPIDLGLSPITATFFQYTGQYGTTGLTSVNFNSGTSQLVFNSGMTGQEITVDLSALSGGTNLISSSNIDMIASGTTNDGDLACSTGLLSTPINNSYVFVYVNGVQVNVGNGVKTTDCYFSANYGGPAKFWNNISMGDLLYWNGSIVGYQLDSLIDKISFIYLTT